MLPGCFIDSYKRYKADTTKIATWLAESAEISGFTNKNNILQPSISALNQQPKAKLKGRARKLAREAANAAKKATTKQPLQQYLIKTKDFVPMALAIASWQPPKVKPSNTILETFKRTIAARKSCAVWYSTASDGYEGHQYFISVLEEALGVLKALIPKVPVDKTRWKPLEATYKKEAVNKYENLILEDADESDDGSKTQSGCTSPKQPPSNIVYEQDEPEKEDESRFASYCLIKDLNDIRQHLLGLWQRYQRKEIDLAVAAATTNMAFNLVRRAEREFATTAVWPKEYAAEWQGSSIAGCLPVIVVNGGEYGGKDSLINSGWSATKSGASVRLPHDMSEGKEEWTFFRACLLLQQCCEGPFPARYSKMTGNSFVQDLILLREIIPGIAAIARHCGPLHFMDELSCGLSVYMGAAIDASPPLWLIFAIQVLLDVHRVLTSSLTAQPRQLIEARLAHEHLLAVFERHFGIHDSWPKSLQHMPVIDDMRRAAKNFECFFSGELEEKIELRMKICATRRQRDLPAEASTDPLDLLESNPILCGMIRYYCFLEVQRYGSDWANITRSIWSATHLYSALSVKDIDLAKTRKGPRMSRKEAAEAKLARNGVQESAGAPLLADFPVWEDIDVVILHQGEQKMLVGGKPKTLEEAIKKWYLAQGYSASTFARGRRENTPLRQSSKSMRHLRSGSTIAQIIYRRCHHCDCDASMTLQDVEAVLTDRHVRTEHASGTRVLNGFSHGQDCMKPGTNTHRGLSTLEMIETLEQGLIAEMPEILFDYFSMDHRCTQFFLDLAASFKSKKKECWTEDFRSGRIEGVTATGRMVPEILRHACDLEKAPGLLPFKACYCVNIEPLRIAREKLEELVSREGSVESKKLAKRVVSHWSGVSGVNSVSEKKTKEATNVKSTSANGNEEPAHCWSSVDDDKLSEGETFECPTT